MNRHEKKSDDQNDEQLSPWLLGLGIGVVLALPFLAVGAGGLYGLSKLQELKNHEERMSRQKEVKDVKLLVDDSVDGFSDVHVDQSEIESNSGVPHAFLCPITQEIMIDPVIIETGQTYERQFIEEWLKTKSTCPITNVELKSKSWIPNYSLKSAILDWKSKKVQM